MTREVADMVAPQTLAALQPQLEEGHKIMVAARGIKPVLNFALEEAQLRKAVLCVVYVRKSPFISPARPATARTGEMAGRPGRAGDHVAHDEGGRERDICVQPVYAVSEDASATILDLAATMGVDYIILGASQRRTLARFVRRQRGDADRGRISRVDSSGDLWLIGPIGRIESERTQSLNR